MTIMIGYIIDGHFCKDANECDGHDHNTKSKVTLH